MLSQTQVGEVMFPVSNAQHAVKRRRSQGTSAARRLALRGSAKGALGLPNLPLMTHIPPSVPQTLLGSSETSNTTRPTRSSHKHPRGRHQPLRNPKPPAGAMKQSMKLVSLAFLLALAAAQDPARVDWQWREGRASW